MSDDQPGTMIPDWVVSLVGHLTLQNVAYEHTIRDLAKAREDQQTEQQNR